MTEELNKLRELQTLASVCPEINMSNYGEDEVKHLNDWAIEMSNLAEALTAAQPAQAVEVPVLARSLSEWHEDDGLVMWWAWNGDTRGWAGEAAYLGSPLCEDWPGYHTHWTPHPSQPVLTAAQQGAEHG